MSWSPASCKAWVPVKVRREEWDSDHKPEITWEVLSVGQAWVAISNMFRPSSDRVLNFLPHPLVGAQSPFMSKGDTPPPIFHPSNLFPLGLQSETFIPHLPRGSPAHPFLLHPSLGSAWTPVLSFPASPLPTHALIFDPHGPAQSHLLPGSLSWT